MEEYVERSFFEFMECRIGLDMPRHSDGKIIREYRNGTHLIN